MMVGLAALSVACSDNAVTATVGDGGGMDTSVDAVSDTQPESDTGGATDTTEVDTAEPDAAQPSTCEPGDGCFGEPCDGNDDCLSGICSMHMGDKVCSKTCDESCPEGWECTLVGAGGDGQYVCISSFTNLCLPCETSEGCAGDTPAACVKYGDGTSFCGGECDEITPCQTGYDCSEVESINGAASFQ